MERTSIGPFKCVTCGAKTWLNEAEQAIVGPCGAPPNQRVPTPHAKPYFFGITSNLIALVADCPPNPGPDWRKRLEPEILESFKAVTPRRLAEYFQLTGINITADDINKLVFAQRPVLPKPLPSRRSRQHQERQRLISEGHWTPKGKRERKRKPKPGE